MSDLAKMTMPVSFIRYNGNNIGAVIEFMMALGDDIKINRSYKGLYINNRILKLNDIVVRIILGQHNYCILDADQFSHAFKELTENEIEKLNEGEK